MLALCVVLALAQLMAVRADSYSYSGTGSNGGSYSSTDSYAGTVSNTVSYAMDFSSSVSADAAVSAAFSIVNHICMDSIVNIGLLGCTNFLNGYMSGFSGLQVGSLLMCQDQCSNYVQTLATKLQAAGAVVFNGVSVVLVAALTTGGGLLGLVGTALAIVTDIVNKALQLVGGIVGGLVKGFIGGISKTVDAALADAINVLLGLTTKVGGAIKCVQSTCGVSL